MIKGEENMNMFSSNNVLVSTAKIDEKKKKGRGIHEILTLMKDLIDFQEKVEACIDAQELSQNKEKIEQFDRHLDDMYDSLLEVVSGGVRDVRKNRAEELSGIADSVNGGESAAMDIPEGVEEVSRGHNITMPEVTRSHAISRPMINAPTAPRM